MSIESLADKTVSILRLSTTTTDTGAYEETFAVWKTWQVRIQPLTAAEMIKLGREATDIGIKLYGVPVGLEEPDRILYGDRTFEVVGVRNIDEQDRLSTVDCVEIL